MKIKFLCLTLIITLGISSFSFSQKFELPKLKYQYSDMEPYIDSKTMEIHYSKHHQGYVNKLNDAIKGTDAEKHSLEELMINVSKFSPSVKNSGGGHLNHTLFWQILSPKPKLTPEGKLLEMIISDFGSLENLKKEIKSAGIKQFGSGWVWLILTPEGKLLVTSTSNQDNPLMDIVKDRGIPILTIDVWEHAYYLKFQNKRSEYLNTIWNVLDWNQVEMNLEKAFDNPNLKRLK